MLIPALTIRPVPAQRRLPIISWISPTIDSRSESDETLAESGADAVGVGWVAILRIA
jgi:hypothetical protein